MTTDPPIYTGVCPYCASTISTVTLEGGMAYARCSHRRCGARGPLMANAERAVDVFTRGKWSIRKPSATGDAVLRELEDLGVVVGDG